MYAIQYLLVLELLDQRRSANKGQLRVGREFMPGKHFLPVEDSLIPEELESQRRCIGRASTVFVDCFIAGWNKNL